MPGDAMINPKTLAVLGIAEAFVSDSAMAGLDTLKSLSETLSVPFIDVSSPLNLYHFDVEFQALGFSC